MPQTLLDQLVIGGIMVIPAGNEEVKQMYKITKVDESNYEKGYMENSDLYPL